jgi:class 3 adenylate cyclase
MDATTELTRLSGLQQLQGIQALGELRRAVDPLIASRGGRIVGTAGDSLLADFSSTNSDRCRADRANLSSFVTTSVSPSRQ